MTPRDRVLGIVLVTAFPAWIAGCGGEDGAGGSQGTGAASATSASSASGGANAASGSGGSTSTSTSTSTSSGGAGGAPSAGEIGPTAASCALPAPPADPVCEAPAGSKCYYLDPVGGDDTAGDGSFAKPWRSFANVTTYYSDDWLGSTPAPATAIQLSPGDVVYLFSGTFADTYNYEGYIQVALFRGLDGSAGARFRILAYPGEKPVLDPGGEGLGIKLLQSSFWEVSGIEIQNAYGRGLESDEVDELILSHLTIHDTDGVDNDNIAGLYFGSTTNVDVGCSVLHDNYDRTNADTGGEPTENSSNFVAFGGGNIRVHHSSVYQTPEVNASKTGGCIKYKHAATLAAGKFEVDHNEIRRCRFFHVATGTQHTHVHHNVIVDGDGIESRDLGGPTHQTDQRFEFNTLYRAGGFGMNPTSDWTNADFDDPKQIAFVNNVVYDDDPKFNQETGTVVIGTYQSDALYQKTVPELVFSGNCYFNPAAPLHFDLFAADDPYGPLGDQYDLAGWKALGFDADAVEADPQFADAAGRDFQLAAGSPCAGKGAYAP